MSVLKQLFESKKFVATLVGAVITLAAKIGLDIDTETAALIVGLFGSFVLSQGVADAGSGKEKVKAEAKANGIEVK